MKIVSVFLLISGFILLGSVVVPVATPIVHSWLTPKLLDPSAVSDNPNLYVVNVLGVSTSDYSSPQVWFNLPPASESALVSTQVKYFTVSIPKVHLDHVTVEINGSDLKKNAIHFSQSVLPGSYGNTVVFGHSALPQFYTPGNPLTIFNPLLKVSVGDTVIVNFDGITYNYVVKDTAEVDADEVSVLSQHYDRRELTLITCTPLGTYWHRFVVRAELEN